MSLTPTNRYMNFGPFSFGGTALSGVFDFSYDAGISDKQEGADGDPGPTVAVVDWQNPSFSVSTYDAMAIQASLGGTRGTFVATLLDAYNKAGAGGGGKVYTTNALSYIIGANTQARYREFATRQIQVKTVWTDPSTPPVSITTL
jgi:hypothetical protein